MNLYLDTEFTGLHQQASLISLALVAEDGRAFYAEFHGVDTAACDDWIQENVLAHTRWLRDADAAPGHWREDELTLVYDGPDKVRDALKDWLADFEQIEIWADCPAWDWVLFCELFGGAFGLPENIYYLPFDLVSLFKARGVDPDIDREAFAGWNGKKSGMQIRHNALYDARLTMACHQKLNGKSGNKHRFYDLPLDYYHATFLLPLFGLDESGININREPYVWGGDLFVREVEHQSLRYFSPVLRDLLFDTGRKTEARGESRLQPIKEWRYSAEELENSYITLTKGSTEGREWCMEASLMSVNLYRYFNGLYILSYRVAPKENQGMRLGDWLRFTQHARQLYSAYPEQEAEGKQSVQRLYLNGELKHTEFETGSLLRYTYPGEEVSQIVRGLLQGFAAEPSGDGESSPQGLSRYFQDSRQWYDDRMYVSVAYGLRDSVTGDKLEKISALAGWVDTVPDDCRQDYAYDEQSIRSLIGEKSYGLWRHKGGNYVFTDFSNAYVYCGERFFNEKIAPVDIVYIYDRMLLQALFYQSSLRHYDQMICADTDDIINNTDTSKARLWRENFIRFTNQYWFHNLTEQMQGKMIFRLQQQALGLQEHYHVIKDQLERTDEFLQTQHERRMAKISDIISHWGLAAALLAVWFTVLPLVVGSGSLSMGQILGWIGLPAVVVLGAVWVVRKLKQ